MKKIPTVRPEVWHLHGERRPFNWAIVGGLLVVLVVFVPPIVFAMSLR